MEYRSRPVLTFAQARYANTSHHPAASAFPAGCHVLASLSTGDSVAMDFVYVAAPALALAMLILWMTRLVVMRLEAQRMCRYATNWGTLPHYIEVQAVAATLRPKRPAPSQEAAKGIAPAAARAVTGARVAMHCTICLTAIVDHPVELLPCGHQQFCAHCLVQMWQCSGMYRQMRCPLCRQPVELMCPVSVTGSRPSIDDVLLMQKYNGGFCGAKKLSLLDRCVLRLRIMTHARLLPIVIGLRIAVLHITMLTYMLWPIHLTEVADTVAQQTAKHDAPSSAIAVACSSAVQALTTVVYTPAAYADDICLAAVGVILTGHFLQSALFHDLKP
ncbi:hypothetical protein JKF63_07257 [Porcisia hertigi]|uniref:RING-type domain-containing protein n=1 Tax=Porcisia hertigi TaxID=2761500 RepID=A0A836LL89_9TRYP|nr:hypothetical protein JKF63_07257 [Porcisia hertigi]